MRYIEKGIPPQVLIDYKRTPNATYEGFPSKEEVRIALIKEQKGLCAYCNGRISNDWDNDLQKIKTEIEHFKSQKHHKDLQLEYSNMLGVCNGIANSGMTKQLLHCDKNKGDRALTINPLSKNCELQVIYNTTSGKIMSNDASIHKDLTEILNLNEQNLLNNRRDTIDQANKRIMRFYPKKKGEGWTKADIQKEIDFWNALDKNGNLKPYCQIAIFYLQNKLKRL